MSGYGYTLANCTVRELPGPESLLVDRPEYTLARADGCWVVTWPMGAAMVSDDEPALVAREKYWGRIETLIGGSVCLKRIACRAGSTSSLEYHCRKVETYYLASGRLDVGIRAGRGENGVVEMRPGDCVTILPGCMHCRIAHEDSVIIEVSTRDSDADSHIVEDGRRYRHRVGVRLLPGAPIPTEYGGGA